MHKYVGSRSYMLSAQLVSENYFDYEVSFHNRVGMAPNKSSRVMRLKWVASAVYAYDSIQPNFKAQKSTDMAKHYHLMHLCVIMGIASNLLDWIY